MRMKLTVFASMLCTASLSMPFTAQADERAEKIKIATTYIEQTIADFDFPALIQTMWKPMVVESERQGRPVSDEQKAELSKLYSDSFTEPMKQLMLKQSNAFAEIFSLEELIALRDFYQTPEGRSVMRKMPKVLESQQPALMAFVQGELQQVLPKALKILNVERK